MRQFEKQVCIGEDDIIITHFRTIWRNFFYVYLYGLFVALRRAYDPECEVLVDEKARCKKFLANLRDKANNLFQAATPADVFFQKHFSFDRLAKGKVMNQMFLHQDLWEMTNAVGLWLLWDPQCLKKVSSWKKTEDVDFPTLCIGAKSAFAELREGNFQGFSLQVSHKLSETKVKAIRDQLKLRSYHVTLFAEAMKRTDTVVSRYRMIADVNESFLRELYRLVAAGSDAGRAKARDHLKTKLPSDDSILRLWDEAMDRIAKIKSSKAVPGNLVSSGNKARSDEFDFNREERPVIGGPFVAAAEDNSFRQPAIDFESPVESERLEMRSLRQEIATLKKELELRPSHEDDEDDDHPRRKYVRKSRSGPSSDGKSAISEEIDDAMDSGDELDEDKDSNNDQKGGGDEGNV